MPILQSRMKRLLDAAILKEDQLITIYNNVSNVCIKYHQKHVAADDAMNEIVIQLELAKSVIPRNATIAEEKARYNLTHANNAYRAGWMRKKRGQAPQQGELTSLSFDAELKAEADEGEYIPTFDAPIPKTETPLESEPVDLTKDVDPLAPQDILEKHQKWMREYDAQRKSEKPDDII